MEKSRAVINLNLLRQMDLLGVFVSTGSGSIVVGDLLDRCLSKGARDALGGMWDLGGLQRGAE